MLTCSKTNQSIKTVRLNILEIKRKMKMHEHFKRLFQIIIIK